LRREFPELLLGGWANPYRDPVEQVTFLEEHRASVDFVLTQVVSHHESAPLARLLEEMDRRSLDLPVFAGLFYYRSARAQTLDRLARFIPVPRAALEREFAGGASPLDVAARSLRAAAAAGASRFYVSNLEVGRAVARLAALARAAGIDEPARLAPAGRPSYERRRR